MIFLMKFFSSSQCRFFQEDTDFVALSNIQKRIQVLFLGFNNDLLSHASHFNSQKQFYSEFSLLFKNALSKIVFMTLFLEVKKSFVQMLQLHCSILIVYFPTYRRAGDVYTY